jgi:N-acetylglutamate synthase-like GNAT family acetyltransferase
MAKIEPGKVTVRVLRSEDFNDIVEIDRLVSGNARPLYYERKMRSVMDDSTQIVSSLAAEVDGKVVGFLTAQVFDGEFGSSETLAIIDTLGVSPEMQRLGVARMLFDEFSTNMRAIGVDRVRTLVDWNSVDLIRFFHSMGFGPVPTLNLERKL